MSKEEISNEIDRKNEDFELEEFQDQKANIINDPISFVAMARNNKKIKIMEEPIPFSDSMSILDISLHKKGPMEDKIYTNISHYFLNVRRGNTVIRVVKPEEEERLYFCRRGLRKFFDLEQEYIKKEDDHLLRNFQRRQKHHILSEAFTRLEKNQTINLYSLFKENGEHCQIGYIGLFDCWIIASKNVCMMVRTAQDLSYYKKERYYWPQLIADVWFNKILKRLTEQEIKMLKEMIDGHTLLGEYCGNPNHQHITIYKEIDIFFYAVVKNNGVNTCIPPEEAFSLFHKFQLTPVKHLEIKNITSSDGLRSSLSGLLSEIASGPMEIHGEGSVVYIVARENKNENEKAVYQDTVLSLCKLKSLEYLIYRKVRELLKKYIKASDDAKKKLSKFLNELKELCKNKSTPRPIDHYVFFVKTAFEQIDNDPKTFTFDYLYYKFVDFTAFISKIIDEKQKQKEELKNPSKAEATSEKSSYRYVDYDYDANEDDQAGWIGTDDDEEQEEEEEEKKVNEVKERKPFRIVMITPPFYISENVEESILNVLSLQAIETNWREEMKMEEIKKSVVNLHMIPKTSEKLGPEVHFVLVGFNKEGMTLSLQNISSLPPGSKTYHPGAFSFINSKNKAQSLDLFFQKLKGFKEHVISTHGPSRITEIDDIYEGQKDKKATKFIEKMKEICETLSGSKAFYEEEVAKENEDSFEKNLIIYVPIGIPAIGKTSLVNKLKKFVSETPDWTMRDISSDRVREAVMKGYKELNPEASREKVWNDTYKSGKREFFKLLRKMLEETSNLPGRNHLIFLDKNHTPNILNENLDYLRSFCPMEIDLKIVAVLPLSSEFSYSTFTYPFSLSTLFTCITRGINREYHETLTGDPVHITMVILKFFQGFKNFRIKSTLLKQLDFDLALYFPYTEESDSKVPDILLKKLEVCLNTIFPFTDLPDPPCVSEFLDTFFASGWEPKKVLDSYMEETVKTNLLKSFKLFKKL